MNVRWASRMTIRSGFITSRIEVRSRSRRISFMATRLPTRRCTSANTSSPGSGTSRNVFANGRAAETRRRSQGSTLSSHQRATSGNDSSRRVSPVGAQSTTITSKSPLAWWERIRRRLKSSSMPGGTVSSSAATPRTPRSARIRPSQSRTAAQFSSSSTCASICWAQSDGAISRGSGPSSCSSESPRLCAGSVERTIVRRPRAAQLRAVAAATLVLPTPPLPV